MLENVLGNDFEKATGREWKMGDEKSYIYIKGYDAGFGDHINGRGVDAEKARTDFIRNEGAVLLYLISQIGDTQDFNTGYANGDMACPTQSHDVM